MSDWVIRYIDFDVIFYWIMLIAIYRRLGRIARACEASAGGKDEKA